jgi:hypothetical protein
VPSKYEVGYLRKKYKFDIVANFEYLGVTLNEGNNQQTKLTIKNKNANKTYFMLQFFFQK